MISLAEAAASLAGAAVAGVVVFAWYGIGYFVFRRSEREHDMLSGARSIAYGAGLWSLVWFVLGLARLYTPVAACAVLTVGVVLGVMALTTRRPGSVRAAIRQLRSDPASASAGIIIVLALTAAFIASLAPPTAKDSLIYHIALPKAFAAAGALITVPNNITSYFPLGVEMHGLSAMLAGRAFSMRVGEAAFGAITFAFLPLLLAVVYGWARRAGVERPWALTAVALVASVPTVYDVAASGYVDLALSLYVALGIEAAAQWWAAPQRRHLLNIALAMGCALAVKLLALFPLLVVALIVLVRLLLHRGDAPPIRGAAGYAMIALAAAALGIPWYVRTWVVTGSPLFPFFMDLWPARVDGWDPERSFLWQASMAQYGPTDTLSRLLTPILVSFTGAREVPALYEGVLGPGFLVGVLFVFWAWRRRSLNAELSVAAAAGLAIFVWWAFSAQLLRYLLPALAPLAVATVGSAAAITRAGVRGLKLGLMAPVIVSLFLLLSWFVADAPLPSVLGREPRAQYLARRLDYYPYYRTVNETLPSDAHVWLIDMRRDSYHLERAYFSDYFFEDFTLRRWVDAATTPQQLWSRARAAGITHVLARHDVLLDYGRSVLVDDGRPREENLARLKLVRSFLGDGTTVLRADAKFVLAKLPMVP